MRRMLFALVLVGCASSSRYIGNGMFTIECKRNRGNCYEEAAKRCPDGFDTLDGSEQSGVYATTSMVGTTAVTNATPTYKGEMLIKCKGRIVADAPKGKGYGE